MGRSSAGMGVQAIARRRLGPARAEALRSAVLTVVSTRLLVLVVAVAAGAVFRGDPRHEGRLRRAGPPPPLGGPPGPPPPPPPPGGRAGGPPHPPPPPPRPRTA